MVSIQILTLRHFYVIIRFRASSSGIVLHLTKTTVTVWETTISNTGAVKVEARLRSKTRVKTGRKGYQWTFGKLII